MPLTALASVVCCSCPFHCPIPLASTLPKTRSPTIGRFRGMSRQCKLTKRRGKAIEHNCCLNLTLHTPAIFQFWTFNELQAEYVAFSRIFLYVRTATCLKILNFTTQGQLWQQLTNRVMLTYVKLLQLPFTNTCQIIDLLTKNSIQSDKNGIRACSHSSYTPVWQASLWFGCSAAAAAVMCLGQS